MNRSLCWRRKERLRKYDHVPVHVSTKFVCCEFLRDTDCTREQCTLFIVNENALLICKRKHGYFLQLVKKEVTAETALLCALPTVKHVVTQMVCVLVRADGVEMIVLKVKR